jgi:hypothetical protein
MLQCDDCRKSLYHLSYKMSKKEFFGGILRAFWNFFWMEFCRDLLIPAFRGQNIDNKPSEPKNINWSPKPSRVVWYIIYHISIEPEFFIAEEKLSLRGQKGQKKPWEFCLQSPKTKTIMFCKYPSIGNFLWMKKKI